LGKGLRVARIVELTPYLQYGIEQTKDDIYKEIYTGFVKAGGILGFNVTHNMYLTGALNFYAPMGDIVFKNDSEVNSPKNYGWADEFANRSGASLMFGVRFEF
jgi:hypothetical protein